MIVEFYLNDKLTQVESEPMQSVLNVLRDDLNNTASKEGCGEGECGACSVLLNGELVNACMTPIAQVEGEHITTLEGLRETVKGKCIINALLEAKGVQCGFCTPGMVLALYVLMEQKYNSHADGLSELEIRTALSGNLCRCTGYSMIVDAAKIAWRKWGEL
ncbi:(2Fe-2S)-binding protein [Aliivibrio kagoshimensis]|uniref:(2Fe-2S)-binding protein n=1 Tax=Aliivibrio kagoshimensis TaxID=2910230 RepID=UPI003D1294D5